jgi:hypothetical protein
MANSKAGTALNQGACALFEARRSKHATLEVQLAKNTTPQHVSSEKKKVEGRHRSPMEACEETSTKP